MGFRKPTLSKKRLNLTCGYSLNKKEFDALNEITLREFEKPINKRRPAFKLVEETRNILNFKKWNLK